MVESSIPFGNNTKSDLFKKKLSCERRTLNACLAAPKITTASNVRDVYCSLLANIQDFEQTQAKPGCAQPSPSTLIFFLNNIIVQTLL